MGVVLKILLLLVGSAATLIALTGDAIDSEEASNNKSLFPKFNGRGKLSLTLLCVALVLGVWDAFLSDASEQEKIDRLVANGEALEQTTTRLSGIKQDMEGVSSTQQGVLQSIEASQDQISDARRQLGENLKKTKESLDRSMAIQNQLLRLPKVLVSNEVAINDPVTQLPDDQSIACGDVFRYSIVSSNGVSREELASWGLEIQFGDKKFQVSELTGEIIAGGRDGQKHKILIRHPATIDASLSYTIYDIPK